MLPRGHFSVVLPKRQNDQQIINVPMKVRTEITLLPAEGGEETFADLPVKAWAEKPSGQSWNAGVNLVNVPIKLEAEIFLSPSTRTGSCCIPFPKERLQLTMLPFNKKRVSATSNAKSSQDVLLPECLDAAPVQELNLECTSGEITELTKQVEAYTGQVKDLKGRLSRLQDQLLNEKMHRSAMEERADTAKKHAEGLEHHARNAEERVKVAQHTVETTKKHAEGLEHRAQNAEERVKVAQHTVETTKNRTRDLGILCAYQSVKVGELANMINLFLKKLEEQRKSPGKPASEVCQHPLHNLTHPQVTTNCDAVSGAATFQSATSTQGAVQQSKGSPGVCGGVTPQSVSKPERQQARIRSISTQADFPPGPVGDVNQGHVRPVLTQGVIPAGPDSFYSPSEDKSGSPPGGMNSHDPKQISSPKSSHQSSGAPSRPAALKGSSNKIVHDLLKGINSPRSPSLQSPHAPCGGPAALKDWGWKTALDLLGISSPRNSPNSQSPHRPAALKQRCGKIAVDCPKGISSARSSPSCQSPGGPFRPAIQEDKSGKIAGISSPRSTPCLLSPRPPSGPTSQKDRGRKIARDPPKVISSPRRSPSPQSHQTPSRASSTVPALSLPIKSILRSSPRSTSRSPQSRSRSQSKMSFHSLIGTPKSRSPSPQSIEGESVSGGRKSGAHRPTRGRSRTRSSSPEVRGRNNRQTPSHQGRGHEIVLYQCSRDSPKSPLRSLSPEGTGAELVLYKSKVIVDSPISSPPTPSQSPSSQVAGHELVVYGLKPVKGLPSGTSSPQGKDGSPSSVAILPRFENELQMVLYPCSDQIEHPPRGLVSQLENVSAGDGNCSDSKRMRVSSPSSPGSQAAEINMLLAESLSHWNKTIPQPNASALEVASAVSRIRGGGLWENVKDGHGGANAPVSVKLRLNPVQETFFQEVEGKSVLELRAEELSRSCTHQARKLAEVAHQLKMFPVRLEEQLRRWAALEAKHKYEDTPQAKALEQVCEDGEVISPRSGDEDTDTTRSVGQSSPAKYILALADQHKFAKGLKAVTDAKSTFLRMRLKKLESTCKSMGEMEHPLEDEVAVWRFGSRVLVQAILFCVGISSFLVRLTPFVAPPT